MSDAWNVSGEESGNTPGSGEQVPFAAADAQEAVASAQANATAGAPGSSAAGSAAYGPGTAGAAGVPPPGSWGPVGGGYAVPPPPPGVVGSPGSPNPIAAFWLGLIPGVGAMYNGQVAKGFVHLIVFMVLVVIANNISGVFGLFVMGWIFFMAFEAYHTAKARRDGLPLPNAFGWNDIGERMGLGKNWPFSPGAPVASPGAATGTQAAASGTSPGGWTGAPPAYTSPMYPVPPGYAVPPVQPVSPGETAGYAAGPGGASYGLGYGPGVGQGVAPNWAGYVPPSAFASTPPVGSAGAAAGGGSAVPPGHGVPYTPVSAGPPYPGAIYGADVPPAPSRLPVGAIWLIGLGVLFLLSQWTPLLQVSRVWIPSLVLIGVAALLFARRMGWTGVNAWRQTAAPLPLELRVASAVRIPGILVAIAILNGLHEAWVVRWNHSWPWLLIVVGVLMLVERVALRQAASLSAADAPEQKGGL